MINTMQSNRLYNLYNNQKIKNKLIKLQNS